MKLFELHEKRAKAVAAMRSLADTAETEKRDLTTEEDGRFAALEDRDRRPRQEDRPRAGPGGRRTIRPGRPGAWRRRWSI